MDALLGSGFRGLRRNRNWRKIIIIITELHLNVYFETYNRIYDSVNYSYDQIRRRVR